MEIMHYGSIILRERIFIPMSEDSREVEVEYIAEQPAKILIVQGAEGYAKVKLSSTQNISIEVDVEDNSVQSLKLC